MTTGVISPPITFQGFTNNGAVNAGGFVYTYAAGTTTPIATYTDSTLGTPNTNPVKLNAIGQAPIWLTPNVAYKFVETDALGNQCGYVDQILGQSAVTFATAANPFNYMNAAQIADWQAGTGLYDHGPFIQDAVNTLGPVFLPAGTPYVKTQVTVTTPGQRIYGSGLATVITIPASFNLAATGVFYFVQSAQPGAELQDLWINFIQPSAPANFAALTAYPPAVYAKSQPRCKFRNVRITNAITCLELSGNSGGTYVEQCEFSHYLYGINLGTVSSVGCLDTMRVNDCHFWPFGGPGSASFTTQQLAIYNAAANIGINVNNCNALLMSGDVFLCGLGMSIAESTAYNMWANITNCAFDSNDGINMSGGEIFIANSYFSPGAVSASQYSVTQTGGYLDITDSYFLGNAAVSMIINGASALIPQYTNVTNSVISGVPLNSQFMTATATAGQVFLNISGNDFPSLPQNSSPSSAIIAVSSSGTRVQFSGNTAYNKGTGTGTLLSIAVDGSHVITGNNFDGWGLGIPASAAATIVSDNYGVTSGVNTTAGSFQINVQYTITAVGTTNFTAIGASSNTVGVTFTATGAGSGTGTAMARLQVAYKGTGAFSASTSVNVYHGINWNGAAPNESTIAITFTSNPGGYTWVSGINSSYFILSCNNSTSATFAFELTNQTQN